MRPNQDPHRSENLRHRLSALALAVGVVALTACGSARGGHDTAAQPASQVAEVKRNTPPTPTPVAMTPEQLQVGADVQIAAENFATRINSLCRRQPKTYLPKGSSHSSMRCNVIAGNGSENQPKGIYTLNAVGAFDSDGNIIPSSVVWIGVDVLNPGSSSQFFVSLSKEQKGWSIFASKSMIPNGTMPKSFPTTGPDTDPNTAHYFITEIGSLLAAAEAGTPLAA